METMRNIIIINNCPDKIEQIVNQLLSVGFKWTDECGVDYDDILGISLHFMEDNKMAYYDNMEDIYDDIECGVEDGDQVFSSDYLLGNMHMFEGWYIKRMDRPRRKFMVGDKVKIIQKAKSYSFGWANGWNDDMDETIGEIGKVDWDNDDQGIRVKFPELGSWYYPHWCLELVPKKKKKYKVKKNKKFPIGSKVRITRRAKDQEDGWKVGWVDTMDANIGEVGVVEDDKGIVGLEIRHCNGLWNYPHFVLEMVEKFVPEPEVNYKECGRLKIGDKVEIIRQAKSYEGCWTDIWDGFQMDDAIGEIGTVVNLNETDPDRGYGVNIPCLGNYNYPHFVLELIEDEEDECYEEEFEMGELVKVKRKARNSEYKDEGTTWWRYMDKTIGEVGKIIENQTHGINRVEFLNDGMGYWSYPSSVLERVYKLEIGKKTEFITEEEYNKLMEQIEKGV